MAAVSGRVGRGLDGEHLGVLSWMGNVLGALLSKSLPQVALAPQAFSEVNQF